MLVIYDQEESDIIPISCVGVGMKLKSSRTMHRKHLPSCLDNEKVCAHPHPLQGSSPFRESLAPFGSSLDGGEQLVESLDSLEVRLDNIRPMAAQCCGLSDPCKGFLENCSQNASISCASCAWLVCKSSHSFGGDQRQLSAGFVDRIPYCAQVVDAHPGATRGRRVRSRY